MRNTVTVSILLAGTATYSAADDYRVLSEIDGLSTCNFEVEAESINSWNAATDLVPKLYIDGVPTAGIERAYFNSLCRWAQFGWDVEGGFSIQETDDIITSGSSANEYVFDVTYRECSFQAFFTVQDNGKFGVSDNREVCEEGRTRGGVKFMWPIGNNRYELQCKNNDIVEVSRENGIVCIGSDCNSERELRDVGEEYCN